MQLQQLKYVVAAAQYGSFRSAAQKLYVSQSSVSTAVKDLEDETHTTIFERSRRGITVTEQGSELIAYAERILHDVNAMTAHYQDPERNKTRLVVSSLHNLLVTKAFGDFLDQHADESGDFELHEANSNQVIHDVGEGESDIGVIYKSNFSEQAVEQALEQRHLSFVPLFATRPFIVVGDEHPLAGLQQVSPAQLANYDRYQLEQGFETSTFFEEEPISGIPHRRSIVLEDNSSLAALLAEHDGYAIASGLSPANRSLTLVPLETEEEMVIGLIAPRGAQRTGLLGEFAKYLGQRIISYQGSGQIEPRPEAYRLAGVKQPA